MARQPKTLPDETAKKKPVKLRDLPARKQTKGGAPKSQDPPRKTRSPIPKSLEEFLRSDSLRID
jgi:hypothetical protein